MDSLFGFFGSLVAPLTLTFVVLSMFNVGLTQRPDKILGHLSNWQYLLKMLVVNFVVVPALMSYAIMLAGIPAPYSTGLMVFALASGAPLLIKLTGLSDNDLAAGATVLMVMMVGTVLVVPLMLPLVVQGAQVSAWPIAKNLLLQLGLPLVIGMVFAEFAEHLDALIQPWVARISNIALYGLLVATLISQAPNLADAVLWGAVVVGIVVLMIGFLVGFGMGEGRDQWSDLGGLSTAQRGTAAAMIVAQQNFADEPLVFVLIAVLNTVMMIILMALAKGLATDNKMLFLHTLGADQPQRREERASAAASGGSSRVGGDGAAASAEPQDVR